MAEKKEAEGAKQGATNGATAAGGRNPKMLMLAGAGVAALALLGAGSWFLLKPRPEAAAEGADAGKSGEKGKDERKADRKVPYFVEFEPFTVNLKEPERFLQIKLTFQVRTPEGAEQIKDFMPIVRSAVIPVLGTQDAASIVTREGKDRMTTEVATAANEALAKTAAADSIDAVLITHMIIQ